MRTNDQKYSYLIDQEPMDTVAMTLSENPYEIARDYLADILSALGPRDALPAGFLDDTFVLGFLSKLGHAHFEACGFEDADFTCVPEIFAELFDDEGHLRAAHAATLHNEGEPSFMLGVNKAAKLFAALDTSPEVETDPCVAAALTRADLYIAQHEDDETLSTSTVRYFSLLEALFGPELIKRFPDKAEWQASTTKQAVNIE